MSDLFKPTSIILGQQILDSPRSDAPPSLDFFLEITFAEDEFDGETGTPFLRANHLASGTDSWRPMTDFQLVSHDDADMLLFGVRNPVELTNLKISEGGDGTLEISLNAEIDFEMEAYRDELGIVELDLANQPLQLGQLKIHTSLEKRFKGDPDEITKYIAQSIDLTAYSSIEKVPGGYEFPVA